MSEPTLANYYGRLIVVSNARSPSPRRALWSKRPTTTYQRRAHDPHQERRSKLTDNWSMKRTHWVQFLLQEDWRSSLTTRLNHALLLPTLPLYSSHLTTLPPFSSHRIITFPFESSARIQTIHKWRVEHYGSPPARQQLSCGSKI